MYCLFPISIGGVYVVAEISRDTFIQNVLNGNWIDRTESFIGNLKKISQEEQDKSNAIKRSRERVSIQKMMGLNRPRYRRRF